MPARLTPIRTTAIATTTALLGAALAAPAAFAAGESLTLFDFESGTSTHIQWADAGAGVQDLAATGVTPPTSDPNAYALSYGFDLGGPNGYGGIGFEYGADQPAVDLSGYDGIEFWMYSDGASAAIQVELLDAASADPGVYDRYDVTVPVGAAGWQHIQLPFADFRYATDYQDSGAPNDGALDLTWVRGILFPAQSGAATILLDDIGAYTGTTPTEPPPTGPSSTPTVIEDFENELIRTEASATPPLGWFAVAGADNVPPFERVTDPTRPGADATNESLSIDLDTSSWAVVIDTFTDDGTTWKTQDFSGSTALGFWMYGTGSGAPMFVDVLDNRTPDSTVDDAERFSVRFADDVAGWRYVELPFSTFTRKNIGNGAPDDGFTLSEVHGFGIGVEQTPDAVATSILIDDIALIGTAPVRPLSLTTTKATFTATEGASAEVQVKLNRVSDSDVSIDFATSETVARTSTEDLSATAERDFVSTNGTITIPAGELIGTAVIPTIDNGKAEVDETFLVRFSNPQGAEWSSILPAQVSIIDNDEVDPAMIEDAENGIGLLRPEGAATLTNPEVTDAYAGAEAFEKAVQVDGAGFSRDFAMPQDWSGSEGVGMWYFGTGSGDDVTVTLRDNAAASASPWELAWSDEFSAAAGTPADPANWTYETGGWGWGNDELQYYTDSTDNAAHDGEGHMVITTREVPDPAASGLTCWYGPCTHTSARLISEGKYEFAYGRAEVRAQLPEGQPGIWPAVWTLGNDFRDVGWPQTGEIDIMEYVGKLPESIFGTIHGPGYSGGASLGDTREFGEDLSNQWLTFSLEWEPGEIRWYVNRDGEAPQLFFTADPALVAPNEWVYEHPYTLIMNMAVGGNFGGPLGENLTFPQQTKIDYVRIYQAPDTAERFTAQFTDAVAGWQYVTLGFDQFERAAEQPAGAPNDGLTLTGMSGYALSTGQADGSFAVDRIGLVSDVPAPGGGTDGGAGGAGAGSGAGGAGTGSGQSGDPTGQGALANTGGSTDALSFAGLALLLTLVGAVLWRRRRSATR